MGAIKPGNYSTEEVLISKFGRALAHPARAKIIRLLMQKEQFRNVDLSETLQLSFSSVHNHIQVLKDADIVDVDYLPHEYMLKLKSENFDLMKQLLE